MDTDQKEEENWRNQQLYMSMLMHHLISFSFLSFPSIASIRIFQQPALDEDNFHLQGNYPWTEKMGRTGVSKKQSKMDWWIFLLPTVFSRICTTLQKTYQKTRQEWFWMFSDRTHGSNLSRLLRDKGTCSGVCFKYKCQTALQMSQSSSAAFWWP